MLVVCCGHVVVIFKFHWNVLEVCWGHVGGMLGEFWGYVGGMLEVCKSYVGVILGACWDYILRYAREYIIDLNKYSIYAYTHGPVTGSGPSVVWP